MKGFEKRSTVLSAINDKVQLLFPSSSLKYEGNVFSRGPLHKKRFITWCVKLASKVHCPPFLSLIFRTFALQ